MVGQSLFSREISDAGVDLAEMEAAPPVPDGPADAAKVLAPPITKSRPASDEPALPQIALPQIDEDAGHLGGSEGHSGLPAAALGYWTGTRRSNRLGFLASATFHAVALVIMALIAVLSQSADEDLVELIASLTDNDPPKFENRDDLPDPSPAIEFSSDVGDTSFDSLLSDELPAGPPSDVPQDSWAKSTPGSASPLDSGALPWRVSAGGGGLSGRGAKAREGLVKQRGGTPGSQAAVRRGLDWLKAHQRRDGSWRFSHRSENCNAYCRNPGNHASTTGSTALALLPFLGAGQTHTTGDYQDVVRAGLFYLIGRMRTTDSGGDLQEGTMYAQGLATIALCEAYTMTEDEKLMIPAQRAIEFIVNAQDPLGGGWRYAPRQIGDTTSFGWQLMALKSGQMAGFHSPSPSIKLAQKFLDGVQSGGGAYYGYQQPETKQNPTTISIGLLCRMYTGWGRDHAGLKRGVDFINRRGPSTSNMYYNYYATQVMHHWEGKPWQRWNVKMREHLIRTQESEGHETGSWYFEDHHTTSGGRLYNTAVAIMILEVYYRHMPLYSERSVDSDAGF